MPEKEDLPNSEIRKTSEPANKSWFRCLSYGVFLALAIFACSDKTDNTTSESKTYRINTADAVSCKSLAELIEQYEIVPLETNQEALISEPTKIRIVNGRIFVFDELAERVLTFNSSGQFITVIGKKGKGPEEYGSLQDFEVDTDRDRLIFLDISQLAILEYDFDGNFLRKVSLDSYYYALGVGKGHFYLAGSYRAESRKNLMVKSEYGENVNEFFEFPEDVQGGIFYSMSGGIYTNSNSSLYSDVLSAEVFFVSPEEVYPKYKFEFKGQMWPESEKHRALDFTSNPNNLKTISWLYPPFYENENALTFLCVENGKFKRGYFLKKKQQVIVSDGFKADLLSSVISVPGGWHEDGRFVSIVSRSAFQNFVKENPTPSSPHDNLFDLMKSRPIEDNPVLIIYNLKKSL